MRAALCRELGELEDIEVAEVPDPVAGPGQVVIDVAACAANFPDVLMVRGQYQERPELPFVAGQEVAGVISSIGEGVTWIFSIALGVVAIAIVYTGATRVRSRIWSVVLGLLLGGVLGNLGDRLFREPGFAVGHVVDFLDECHVKAGL